MSSQSRHEHEPRTSVRRAYERCLATRQQWRSVRAKTVDEAVRDEAHGDLHEAVMAWFETLVPYISQRPGEVKQLWESAPLWPAEPARIKGVICGNDGCGFAARRPEDDDGPDIPGVDQSPDEERYEPGDDCPYCGIPLEPTTLVETDENGELLYEWACGLKRLSSWSSATETQIVDGDEWDVGQRKVEVPKRLDPDVLLRAARYLDMAAEECGLLEDTERALPTGEL